MNPDIRIGTLGALCTLHVAGRPVGLVRRHGRQYAVNSLGGGQEVRAAVCTSYAVARAALVALVPAQG